MTKRTIILNGKVLFTINLARKAKFRAIGGNPITTSFPARYQFTERQLTPIELQARLRGVFHNVY